jgi:hypothetical protein
LISDSKLLVYPSARFEKLIGHGHSFWDCDAEQRPQECYPPAAFAETSNPIGRIDPQMVSPNPWWKRLVDVVVSATE